MKLKEWNELDAQVRAKITKVMYANDTEEKQVTMAEEWHHNLDDDHKALMKAVSIKPDAIKVTVTI